MSSKELDQSTTQSTITQLDLVATRVLNRLFTRSDLTALQHSYYYFHEMLMDFYFPKFQTINGSIIEPERRPLTNAQVMQALQNIKTFASPQFNRCNVHISLRDLTSFMERVFITYWYWDRQTPATCSSHSLNRSQQIPVTEENHTRVVAHQEEVPPQTKSTASGFSDATSPTKRGSDIQRGKKRGKEPSRSSDTSAQSASTKKYKV